VFRLCVQRATTCACFQFSWLNHGPGSYLRCKLRESDLAGLILAHAPCLLRCYRLSYADSQMVDIHCHILPGLDDGAESLEISCAMAEMAIADGITHVIGTPHASEAHRFIPELVKQRRDDVQARFEGRLILATGCDFHLSFENLQDIRQDSTSYTLNQKNYLLVEFADFSIPPSLDQALHQLQLAGLHPIITHPERNPLIRSQPERLFRWLRQGCYAQVTAQSLLGEFGRPARDVTVRWLEAGAVHFLASDAHNITTRPLRLREAFEQIEKTRGVAVAQALLVDNPLAAFEGRQLPYVPELAEDVGLSSGASLPRRHKRFWFF
jgi:protein-tyrosine phosphatase